MQSRGRLLVTRQAKILSLSGQRGGYSTGFHQRISPSSTKCSFALLCNNLHKGVFEQLLQLRGIFLLLRHRDSFLQTTIANPIPTIQPTSLIRRVPTAFSPTGCVDVQSCTRPPIL